MSAQLPIVDIQHLSVPLGVETVEVRVVVPVEVAQEVHTVDGIGLEEDAITVSDPEADLLAGVIIPKHHDSPHVDIRWAVVVEEGIVLSKSPEGLDEHVLCEGVVIQLLGGHSLGLGVLYLDIE